MLRTRVISAIALFVLVAGPSIAGGVPFLLLIAVIGVLATWEFAALLRQGGYQPLSLLGAVLALLFIAQAQWPEVLPLDLVLVLAVVGSLLAALWHRSAAPATDWAITLAGALYLGWLLGRFVTLRALQDGLLWLLLAALAIWTADVSAYFAGRAFGRHPWWPRHSPKKTWEGYLAGIAAAAVVTGLLGVVLLDLSWPEGVVLGLVIASVSPLGDLAESMIKRQVGAKDSGQLIPGHGGVLDRIDSLLIGVPIALYWVLLRAP